MEAVKNDTNQTLFTSDLHTMHIEPINNDLSFEKFMNRTVSIREITPEEAKAKGVAIHMLHASYRNEKHKLLAIILQPTHGVLRYQEQVLRILNEVVGFPIRMCETIRKQIAKRKDCSQIKGLAMSELRRGFSDNEIDDFWNMLESNGPYLFCRSHHSVHHDIAKKYNKECRDDCMICKEEAEKHEESSVVHTIWGKFDLEEFKEAADRVYKVPAEGVKVISVLGRVAPLKKMGDVSEGIEPTLSPYYLKATAARNDAAKVSAPKPDEPTFVWDKVYTNENPSKFDILSIRAKGAPIASKNVLNVTGFGTVDETHLPVDPETGEPIRVWQNG